YKMGLKKASCVFFQNKENSDFINIKGIIKGKQKLLPGSGVNLNHYQVLDYPNDKVINFLFISRVMKQKGIDQYLDAASFIKDKYPNTEFHILGFCEETYEDKLIEMQNEGIIQYHGMQRDVREFHKISHCTIHPTYYPEGMSNVLLESAACGRPIIATNRSGCREIVDDCVNGYVVEQQNSRDLIKKIEKFLKLSYEEKKQMGLAGRKKVENEFDRKKVVDAYLEEIEEVLR
ncbi:MAG: glycosyltransferase family 4 protein, partial [Candidatus Methanofastidiosa archaeon]|nr:glycosyltransferase family 4 protein [Candidatus Methanofastidiosa archaeon]